MDDLQAFQNRIAYFLYSGISDRLYASLRDKADESCKLKISPSNYCVVILRGLIII